MKTVELLKRETTQYNTAKLCEKSSFWGVEQLSTTSPNFVKTVELDCVKQYNTAKLRQNSRTRKRETAQYK